MDELLAALTDSDFDFTGQASVVRLDRNGSRLELLLELRAFSGTFERQAWLLTCGVERFSLLRSEPFYGLELATDHVLLAPYHDVRVQLGMRGSADDPNAAVADLWTAHNALAGNWFPFDTFLNRSMPLTELLRSTAAVVADGPARFIDAYVPILRAHGIEAYYITERPAKRWVDMAWQPENTNVELLLLEPHDYIVGADFSARRTSVDLLPPVV